MKRGALIVIEGIDRTGKSTQCKALVDNLQKKQVPAEYANFPARNTEIGKVINSYLTSSKDLPDEAIHLLFSANRWERAQSIVDTLERGISVVVDRYCYSGVAFTAAKGLDINWCKAPDAGLPRPDRVFFLTMPLECVKQRKGFGDERYEVLDFQKKVSQTYESLKEDNWLVLDASRPIDVIEKQLLEESLNVVNSIETKPIGKIWKQ
ncbi:thymidylate kinase [Plutella xylostella]|uniref:thymidylate kinase n=1 Tax=Plutella xylostella TaxID=51655 RepID=UPI002032C7D3|nr:thymidylate kinase [Plutella xylostella]